MKRWYLVAALTASMLPSPLAAQAIAAGERGPVVSAFAAAFEGVSAERALPAAWADVDVAPPTLQPQVRGRGGRTYMIAGAAAFVGGLLIGDEIGNLIAAGGVVLAVYGIILYY